MNVAICWGKRAGQSRYNPYLAPSAVIAMVYSTASIAALSAVSRTLPDVARQIIEYDPADQPDAEVLVDQAWWPAEVRQWVQRDDGTWWANVCWHRDGDSRLDNFPADRVRKDTVDRSRGRG